MDSNPGSTVSPRTGFTLDFPYPSQCFLPAGSFSSRPGSTFHSPDREIDDFDQENELKNTEIHTENLIFMQSEPGKSLDLDFRTMKTEVFREIMGNQRDFEEEDEEKKRGENEEKLLRKLEKMQSNCRIYKRKSVSDRSKLSSILRENKTAIEKLMEIRVKLGDILEIQEEEGNCENIYHLCNHLASQVDILCSRHNRLKSKRDELSEENEKLHKEIEMLRKSHQEKWFSVENRGPGSRQSSVSTASTLHCRGLTEDSRLMLYSDSEGLGSSETEAGERGKENSCTVVLKGLNRPKRTRSNTISLVKEPPSDSLQLKSTQNRKHKSRS